jgi:hypothetical protein
MHPMSRPPRRNLPGSAAWYARVHSLRKLPHRTEAQLRKSYPPPPPGRAVGRTVSIPPLDLALVTKYPGQQCFPLDVAERAPVPSAKVPAPALLRQVIRALSQDIAIVSG